jgi:hypothetical protein
VVIQPYLAGAQQLFDIDYRALSRDERVQLASQLREIIRRSPGLLPRHRQHARSVWPTSTSTAERARLNKPLDLPQRLWSFWLSAICCERTICC